jgi:2-polyprenyl-6-methoxyphenol hydroxylase-like FAD-dependent oxidoreductase
MMLGVLLARAGVDVTVLEKHGDFLRDFRGDTVHPSTMMVMHELGWLDAFLARPHDMHHRLSVQAGGDEVVLGDLRFLPVPPAARGVAFMPQWEFLNFLAERGREYGSFHLVMNAEVVDLTERDGRVTGVRVRHDGGETDVEAALVVAADGRGSVVRQQAHMTVEDLGAPMDVLWFRLSRRASDGVPAFLRFVSGGVVVIIARSGYYQCGIVVPKNGYDAVKAEGLDAFRARVAAAAPALHDRPAEITSWDQVKLLTVRVDRLREWAKPGLLCIGDAAHAMSPVGGVGINLAVQDAVAAANLLASPLAAGSVVPLSILECVQARRALPTRFIQRLQVVIQNRLIRPTLDSARAPGLPWPVRLVGAVPLLQRLAARVIGLGVRPEHVRTPAAR